MFLCWRTNSNSSFAFVRSKAILRNQLIKRFTWSTHKFTFWERDVVIKAKNEREKKRLASSYQTKEEFNFNGEKLQKHVSYWELVGSSRVWVGEWISLKTIALVDTLRSSVEMRARLERELCENLSIHAEIIPIKCLHSKQHYKGISNSEKIALSYIVYQFFLNYLPILFVLPSWPETEIKTILKPLLLESEWRNHRKKTSE